MTQNLINKPDILSDQKFVPLSFLKHKLKEQVQSPYRTTFSFAPVLETWETKNGDSEIIGTVKSLVEKMESGTDGEFNLETLKDHPGMKIMMSMVCPSFFFEGQMGFVAPPFTKQFVYITGAFEELMASDKWEIRKNDHQGLKNPVLEIGKMILNSFYDQEIDMKFSELMTLRNTETGLEKYFKINIVLDYVRVKKLKPLIELDRDQIHQLINDMNNVELWLQNFPPENFAFEGFALAYMVDVSDMEILSNIKAILTADTSKSDHINYLNILERQIASFLNMPELRFGSLQTESSPWQKETTWSLLRTFDPIHIPASLIDPRGSYGQLMQTGQAVIVEDLAKAEYQAPYEKNILADGFHSLLIAPLKDEEGKILGVFEPASPRPYRFNRFTLARLKEVISLTETGMNAYFKNLESTIRSVIQQQFTSIHPSVEWRFRTVAMKYYWTQFVEKQQMGIDPIVFEDVYPLYGQADIKSSSKLRNESIRADLIDNLERLDHLLDDCRDKITFHLLEVYQVKISAHLNRLKSGEFSSSDETQIVDLLTLEVHPLLRQLAERFPELPGEGLSNYFNALDPDLDIIYHQRKDYEESVRLLNQAVSYFVEQEDEKMQQIMPHYFEKYKTDGVEYNLYLGQSILQEGQFSNFYLQDFRLWQLIKMCEITRLVEEQSKILPVPLKTAQLVFIYNSPLSIRFRMDEKQFDVDGAYNVRYEILKKRIDKAHIKGTNERLTQVGKIAMVYLQEKDKQEYLEYLNHLVFKGFIKEEIEALELEELQGAAGLKALRVEVVL